MNFTADHIIQLVSILMTLIVGGGAWRFFTKYGSRLSANETGLIEVKKTLHEKIRQVESLVTEMGEVKISLASIQQTLTELKDNSSRLSLIGEINVKVDNIYRCVEKAIPRNEFDVWKENVLMWREGAQRQMDSLEHSIEATQAHIAKECPLAKVK
jgi:hypothetical protein